jgi:hypothetical protein
VPTTTTITIAIANVVYNKTEKKLWRIGALVGITSKNPSTLLTL